LEIIAGLIAEKWAASSIGTDASRSFADKHDFRIQIPIQIAEDGGLVRKIRADPARMSIFTEFFK
jgi:hypothetical protein